MVNHVSEEELLRRLEEAGAKVEVGARYRHSKTGLEVVVLHIGLIEEAEQPAVIYQHEDGAKIIWARPADAFIEIVEIDGKKVSRFQKL
jgi:hypothetical protein